MHEKGSAFCYGRHYLFHIKTTIIQSFTLANDYIDVHILLEGEEMIGWKALEDLQNETKAYSKEDNNSELHFGYQFTYFTTTNNRSMRIFRIYNHKLPRWKALEDLQNETKAYSKEEDCALYSDRPTTYVSLLP